MDFGNVRLEGNSLAKNGDGLLSSADDFENVSQIAVSFRQRRLDNQDLSIEFLGLRQPPGPMVLKGGLKRLFDGRFGHGHWHGASD